MRLLPRSWDSRYQPGTLITNQSINQTFTSHRGGCYLDAWTDGRYLPGSVVDPDPYWIPSQELSGSGSIFGIRIRIHTCKYRIKCRQKKEDLSYKFKVQKLNKVKISLGEI